MKQLCLFLLERLWNFKNKSKKFSEQSPKKTCCFKLSRFIGKPSQQIKALLNNPSSFWKILNLSAVFYRIYFTKLLPETGTAPVDTILGDFFLSSKREKLPNKRLIKKNGTIEQNLPHWY